MILQIYSYVSYISELEARSRAGGYFSRKKTQHKNTINVIIKCAIAYRIQYHDKFHGISHVSRIGRII